MITAGVARISFVIKRIAQVAVVSSAFGAGVGALDGASRPKKINVSGSCETRCSLIVETNYPTRNPSIGFDRQSGLQITVKEIAPRRFQLDIDLRQTRPGDQTLTFDGFKVLDLK